WLRDPASKRDTLHRLASHHAARGDYHEAEECLLQALDLQARTEVADPLTRAELADELADVLANQRAKERTADVGRWREQAISDYRKVLKPPTGEPSDAARVVSAFWKLQTHYQKHNQLRAALQLSEEQGSQWAGVLGGSKLKSQQGTLRAILSEFT